MSEDRPPPSGASAEPAAGADPAPPAGAGPLPADDPSQYDQSQDVEPASRRRRGLAWMRRRAALLVSAALLVLLSALSGFAVGYAAAPNDARQGPATHQLGGPGDREGGGEPRPPEWSGPDQAPLPDGVLPPGQEEQPGDDDSGDDDSGGDDSGGTGTT